MLPAVILAAGASSRMRRPKALLPSPDGLPFVARIVHALAEAGVSDIVVVSGDQHDAIVAALAAHAPARARVARNPDPARGQLSSLWTGMDAAIAGDTEGLMMTLVDVPMVDAASIRRVVSAWRTSRAPIVRPAIGERHGHPVIFDRAVFDALRRAPLDAGAKSVVRAHAAAVIDVPVAGEGCLIDIDTPDDYEALQRRGGWTS